MFRRLPGLMSCYLAIDLPEQDCAGLLGFALRRKKIIPKRGRNIGCRDIKLSKA